MRAAPWLLWLAPAAPLSLECVLLNEGLPGKELHGQIILGKADFSKVKV